MFGILSGSVIVSVGFTWGWFFGPFGTSFWLLWTLSRPLELALGLLGLPGDGFLETWGPLFGSHGLLLGLLRVDWTPPGPPGTAFWSPIAPKWVR